MSGNICVSPKHQGVSKNLSCICWLFVNERKCCYLTIIQENIPKLRTSLAKYVSKPGEKSENIFFQILVHNPELNSTCMKKFNVIWEWYIKCKIKWGISNAIDEKDT